MKTKPKLSLVLKDGESCSDSSSSHSSSNRSSNSSPKQASSQRPKIDSVTSSSRSMRHPGYAKLCFGSYYGRFCLDFLSLH